MEDIALELGLKGIWKGSVFIYKGLRGSDCKRLEKIVNNLLPIVKQIFESNSESSSNLSLRKFQEFRDNLMEVNKLVAEHKTTRDPILKIQINNRVKKLESSINRFIQNDLQIVMGRVQEHLSNQLGIVCALQEDMLNAQVHLSTQLEIMNEGMETVREKVDAVHKAVVTLGEAVETGVQSLGRAVENGAQTLVESVHQELQIFMTKFEEQQIERLRQDGNLCKSPDFCSPPDTPSGFLGFDEHIIELKEKLLNDGVNVVGVTAMGGAGKSTLAAAVCNHDKIKGYFKERVIYIEVSESPDLLAILKTMWRKILGPMVPDFTNVQNAHKELQLQIKLIKKPTLVILDDIWSKDHLKKLLFEDEEKQYKTLVTTRDSNVIANGPNTHIYKLPLLQPQHALSLFCHYAFAKTFIPLGWDKQLVEKVQQECNGLPLALKVIGSSLYGKSNCDWEQAEKGLSAGPFHDDHKERLLDKLKTSIDVLNNLERECFLDLGAFPQRKVFPAKELLDIWVYVRGMKMAQAKMLLGKFADRHLFQLKQNNGTLEITDNNMDGYSISQHDIMRELALYLAKDDCRRLYMPKIKNHLPSKWEILSSKAHIVSIHTGAMEDTEWPKMEFPKVKVLVLYFTASEYCIPTFLHTMKNLKVLIIHNTDGAKRSKVSGVAGFQELSQLKALHLERLIIPEEWKVLKSLEKIDMCLCEGLDRDKAFNFPGLLEFNVSYCIDLEELPSGLCSSVSLKRLSVTHCHRLAKLPDEMNRLESLKQIRLFESPSLKALPSSICNLKKLKFLDISSCIRMNVNKRVRCELKETLETVAKLPSLKLVVCDKKHEKLFKMNSRTDLKVQAVAEQEPNLDWLDLEIRNERY